MTAKKKVILTWNDTQVCLSLELWFIFLQVKPLLGLILHLLRKSCHHCLPSYLSCKLLLMLSASASSDQVRNTDCTPSSPLVNTEMSRGVFRGWGGMEWGRWLIRNNLPGLPAPTQPGYFLTTPTWTCLLCEQSSSELLCWAVCQLTDHSWTRISVLKGYRLGIFALQEYFSVLNRLNALKSI